MRTLVIFRKNKVFSKKKKSNDSAGSRGRSTKSTRQRSATPPPSDCRFIFAKKKSLKKKWKNFQSPFFRKSGINRPPRRASTKFRRGRGPEVRPRSTDGGTDRSERGLFFEKSCFFIFRNSNNSPDSRSSAHDFLVRVPRTPPHAPTRSPRENLTPVYFLKIRGKNKNKKIGQSGATRPLRETAPKTRFVRGPGEGPHPPTEFGFDPFGRLGATGFPPFFGEKVVKVE